jgi:hypothetical protein
MFTHSRKVKSAHDVGLPDGPDEIVGFTERGKSLVGILLIVSALGLLIWLAISLAES